MTQNYDAVLRCGRLEGDFIGDRVNGRIFGDRRSRGRFFGDPLNTGNHPFPDGSVVRTSAAVSYENGILTTEGGTRYKVEIDR